MIVLLDKEDCCGCEACVQICPKQCITFNTDSEGFYYPLIDRNLCIDCHLCEKVCPVVNQDKPINPHIIYAAKNKNEQVRKISSSGGIFTKLAESIIEQGGVVFGAEFDNEWKVIHNFTETIDGLNKFRNSKYLQSRIGDSYKNVKKFLIEGRKVLFTGVPCQISGLRKFLCKDYDNLLLVDIICHGVPSPLVWKLYLDNILKTYNAHSVKDLCFRNKTTGWKHYSFYSKIELNEGNLTLRVKSSDNTYMRGFLAGLYLRPSCHKCPSKSGKSGSDITLADFWGIDKVLPNFDDDKGVSMVIIGSKKGVNAYNEINIEHIEVTPSTIQSPYYESSVPNKNRSKFFEVLNRSSNINHTIKRYSRPKIKTRLKGIIKKILLTLIGKKIVKI